MNTRRFVKRAVHFYDFDRSERFSDEKSSFFRFCSELPRVDDPSCSEAENHSFSASTSSPCTFRDIFVIFVRSPSRIFRKITILSTVSTMNTRRFVKKKPLIFYDFELELKECSKCRPPARNPSNKSVSGKSPTSSPCTRITLNEHR